MAHQMNLWGAEGCQEHRQEIIIHLKEAGKKKGVAISLAAKLASGWFVDEAIRRSEKSSCVDETKVLQLDQKRCPAGADYS